MAILAAISILCLAGCANGSGHGDGKTPGGNSAACDYKFSPGENDDASTRRLHCHHIYMPGEKHEMHEYTSAPDPGATAKAKFVKDVNAVAPHFKDLSSTEQDMIETGLAMCQDMRNNVPESTQSLIAGANALDTPFSIDQAVAVIKTAHADLCPQYDMVISTS
jgi:hypothetical protein